MDFPLFHLDFLGNRFLIAFIAVIHVFINHPMAVGAIPLIALMEWWGKRTGDVRWDQLAYKLLLVCFIITTSVGAMTGVGIWFSTSLVNPAAIGSLIRVFYWAWFSEWIVFVSEVILILIYFLTWKKMQERKNLHIGIGVFLAIFSWLTMAIIVGILGYMMDVGNWNKENGMLTAFFNPIYLPQLAFRTPVAMMTAGLFALFLLYFFTQKGSEFRRRALRFVGQWSILWLPFSLAGGLWYWSRIPATMEKNLPVAIGTQAFETQYGLILNLLVISSLLILAVLLWLSIAPVRVPRVAFILPFVIALLSLGMFERVREFIRKPYVISEYMYANGIRVEEYPLLTQTGVLPHAAYSDIDQITDENRVQAGEEVFLIACSRCHTTNGLNGVLNKFENLYGADRWERDTVKAYIRGMHNVRTFMPPFPGNEDELDALTEYIFSLRQFPRSLKGAQSAEGSVKGVSQSS